MPLIDLDHKSTSELMSLFSTLEAPSIEEMNGEYAARMLSQRNVLVGTLSGLMLSNPLRTWQCKAFRPVNHETGRGYNTFIQGRKLIQCYPMMTLIAPSRFDGRPAYQLIYRQFHSVCGTIHMIDEVRRYKTGIYIGVGTLGFTSAQRSEPYPFLLEGPAAPYRGDIGIVRKNFKTGPRELPID
jgi:hypothetical protein